MRLLFLVVLSVLLVSSVFAVRQASAQFYTWTDAKGVVHMTDRKDQVPAGKAAEVPGSAQATSGGASVEGGRAGAVKAMLSAARANPRLAELRSLAAEYRRSHTYSKTDYFVCLDMALEMANILKTLNFKPQVVAGTVKTDVAGMIPEKMMTTFDHAWVVVELDPGIFAAVETTGGFVADEKIPNFDYYYQGLVFKDPRQAKDTDVLIRTVNEDCAKARDLIADWNARYAGRPADAAGLEAKGRLDAKVIECTGAKQKYAEMIKSQFRKLY